MDINHINGLLRHTSPSQVLELIQAGRFPKSTTTQVGGAHYKGKIQHWEFVSRMKVLVPDRIGGRLWASSWPENCASKYLCRVFKKNGLQDVEKVMHYLYRLMEEVALGITVVPPDLHLHTSYCISVPDRSQFSEEYSSAHPLTEPEYAGIRALTRPEAYKHFFGAQDLNCPTDSLKRTLFNCVADLGSWTSFEDLHRVFISVSELRTEFERYLKSAPRPDATTVMTEVTSPVPSELSTAGSVSTGNGIFRLDPTLDPRLDPTGFSAVHSPLRGVGGGHIHVDDAGFLGDPSEPTSAYVDQDRGPLTELGVQTDLNVAAKQLEHVRRDPESFDNQPIVVDGKRVDYSTFGLKLEAACSHLRESLPNAQSKRTSLALALMNEGVRGLNVWAGMKGLL